MFWGALSALAVVSLLSWYLHLQMTHKLCENDLQKFCLLASGLLDSVVQCLGLPLSSA